MTAELEALGLRKVHAIATGSADGDHVEVIHMAWFDEETNMFFSKDGRPAGVTPTESARSVMPVVEIHPALSSSPFGRDAMPDRRLTDLSRNEIGFDAWTGTPPAFGPNQAYPRLFMQYVHAWCGIVARQDKRYDHVYGFVIRWGVETPTVLAHSWIYDTHTKQIIEPDAAATHPSTYLGRRAPSDLCEARYRSLTDLRLFYAGLPVAS